MFNPYLLGRAVSEKYIELSIERVELRVKLRNELFDTLGISGKEKKRAIVILKLLSM